MAQNTLLFEVGVESTVKGLNELKQQLTDEAATLQEKLNLKVKLVGLEDVAKKLSMIGDSKDLRNLRQEISAINQEFAKLAAGAGGTGSIPLRGLSQGIVEAEEKVKSYQNTISQLEGHLRALKSASPDYAPTADALKVNQQRLTEWQGKLENLRSQMDVVVASTAKVNSESSNLNTQGFTNLENKVQSVNTVVETLARNISQLVTQMGKTGTPPTGGGILDPMQFTALQEAISQVVKEVTRLGEALSGLKLGNLTELTTAVNSLHHNATTAADALKQIDTGAKFNKSEEEIAAYEKRINELKEQIKTLEAQAKNTADAVKKMNTEFQSVGEKKGSETAKNKNISDLNIIIDNVNKALKGMGAEWRRLIQNDAFDAGLKSRIKNLVEYRKHLKDVMGYSNITKPGALGSTEFMFNGDILNSKRYRSMYSARAMKDFAKDVDDVISRKKAVDDMSAAFERMKQAMLGVGTSAGGGMRGVSANLETINKVGELNIQTLIKEQGHIERLMAVAQKSITFGEKFDVMGMSGKRAQQRANLEYLQNVKDMIDYILKNRNQPEWMRFLNTPQSLRIPLAGSGNDIALLGGHFDQLTHNVKTTAQAMRQLKADMSLESANWNKQWNTDNLTRGLYNVETAIKNIMQSWERVSSSASPEMAKIVAQQLNNLNAVRRDIASAMDNQNILGSRHGYATAMDANYHIQLKEAKVLLTEINDLKKADAQQLREANQYTKESIRNYNLWAESVRKASIEYTELGIKIRQLERTELRLRLAGGDSTAIQDVIGKLKAYRDILFEIKNGSTAHGTAKEFIRGENYQRELKFAKEVERTSTQAATALERADNKAIKDLETKETNQRKYNSALNDMENILNRLSAAESRGAGLMLDTTKIQAAINMLNQFIDKTLNFDTRNFGDNHAVRELTAEWNALKKTLNEVAKEQDNLSKAQEKAKAAATKALSAENAARRQAVQQIREQAQASVNARKESLQAQAKELQQLLSLGSSKLGTTQYDAVRDALRAIRDELRQIETMTQRGGLSSGLLMSMGSGRNYDGIISSARAVAEMREKAVTATVQLTEAEQRFAQAIGRSTDQMKNQSQVLSDLKMMATQYLSVWGAQSFVHSIIETGGLLEQQRLSIGAILQHQEHANELFENIKALAIQSPFGVVQLDKMSKQLTAYGFEYKELYDWTKRLADISAATGTEVSRLSLALGHVRAEGALSGYTLRQFAMANVPVLRMLSENLGITTKEVRDRVRKKEISYDDVKDIFMELTNEGGMFYNAQEVMSQALNAKFKNLRDAFDIMYGEIAEGGVGEALKGVAMTLTSMAKHWERVASDILMAVTAFGAMRAMTLLTNNALGANTVSTLNNIKATLQQENAKLRLAKASGLVTKAEYKQLVTHGAYTASSLKVALVEKKITIEELQRAVALGRVNKQVAMAAATQAGYNATLISGVKVLGVFRRGAFLMSEAFQKLRLTLKSVMASFWPLLALSAVFELVSRNNEQNDQAKGAGEAAAKATNKYSDLQEMTAHLGSAQSKTNDQLEVGIKEMKDALVAVGAYTEELKNQVDSVETLAEKYELLRKAMKNVSDQAANKTERKSALISEAMSVGSGSSWLPWNWFRDNVLKDVKDVDDYNRELDLVFDTNQKVLQKGLKEILTERKKWKKEYETMSVRDIFMGLSEKEQDDILYRMRWQGAYSNKYKDVGEELASVLYGDEVGEKKDMIGYSYYGAIEELRGHRDDIVKYIRSAFNVDFPDIDLDDADTEQKIIFDKWLNNLTKNLEDVKEAGKKALHDVVIEGTIRVVPKYKLDNEAFNDFIEEMKEQYPLAYEQWQRHGKSSAVDSEEEQRKSAESYKRTLGNASVRTIGNEAKKRLKELKEERKRLVDFQSSIVYKDSQEQQAENKAAITKIDEETKRLKQAQKDYNQFGDADKKKGEDKNAKALRERVRILKEAADSYQYWRKAVGDGGAVAHVNSEFGELLGELGYSFDDVDKFRETLTRLREEYNKKPKSKAMLEALKELDKMFADLDRKDFEKATAEELSKVQIELDSLTRSWDMFNTVREATGDVELSVKLTGTDGNTRNLADALKKKVEQDFASLGSAGVSFNMNYSDKQIKEEVEKAVPQGDDETVAAYQKRIAGLVEEYKKWRDLQRDVVRNDITTFAQLLGSSQDYQTQLQKIDDNLDRQLEAIDNLERPSRYTDEEWESWKRRAKAIAEAKAEADKFKMSNEYVNLMNHSLSMTSESIKTAADAVEDNLNKQLKNGVIEAHQYAEEIEKVHQIIRDKKLNSFFGMGDALGSFFTGGINGAVSWYDDAIIRMRSQLAKEGITDKEEQDKNTELEKLLNSRKDWENVQKSMTHVTTAVDIATGVFDGLSTAAQSLSDMFAALGNDSAANTWSDINDGIKGVASALSPVDGVLKNIMSGNVSGSISSVLSAPVQMITGPVTSFAQLYDKGIQREIDAIQDQVKALESNTEAIRAARARTLGYDEGRLRTYYQQQYGSDMRINTAPWLFQSYNREGFSSAAREAMNKYYSQNGGGTGYSQELANLRQERESYLELYNLEQEKKDSSNEALEEYRAKIAELDDQILYFVEDLTNELWGIDFKGWSEQISDAIWTAMENGEDAFDAFHDAAKDIISDVAKRMGNLHFIEPLFTELEEKLFGTMNSNGNRIGGVAMDENGNFNELATLKALGEFFGEGGPMEKGISDLQAFYDAVKKTTGIDFGNESRSTSSKVIQGGFTEDETGLLLSYVNGIRADVSMNRQLLGEYFPMYRDMLTSGNRSLQNIENNTAAIMRNTDSMRESIQTLQSDFRGLKNKQWSMPVS